MKTKDIMNDKFAIVKCGFCGKEIKRYISDGIIYCSRECYYKSKIGSVPWNKGKKGQIAWNKGLKGYGAGKKHPWMAKGKDHYNYRGGISREGYPEEWKVEFLDSIRQRDGFICQECGIHQDELSLERTKKLDIHHIDYDKENCDPKNLVSLCRSCHTKTNFNRDFWTNYFRNNNNG
jgi:5-methylcytosine-specific restriction endonuclease McrA